MFATSTLTFGRSPSLRICDNRPSLGLYCSSLIMSTKYFDEDAFNYCKGLPTNTERMNCLEIIKDHHYQNYALRSCLEIDTGVQNSLACLVIIADRVYSTRQIMDCDLSGDFFTCIKNLTSQL